MTHRFLTIALLTGWLSTGFAIAPAQASKYVQDGFSEGKSLNGNYFSIYLENGVNMQDLAMRIATPASLKAIIRQPYVDVQADDLPSQFDLLFLAVSEIMDIRLKTFKVDVKICKNAESLRNVSERIFGTAIQTGGFFVVPYNTLYVDAENVSIYILGHELSHAIQSHYFVVPPPEKIQEVLAGFVEYELRKRVG